MAQRTTSPQKSRLEAARERMYRELVLEAAEHVFAQKGFDDATMQEIAAEGGISLKKLYATVAGKQELYESVLEARGVAFIAETAEALEAASGDDGVLGALPAAVRAYVSFLDRHRNFLLIHLREGRAWGLPVSDGPGERLRDQGESLFSRIVERGIGEGVFYDEDPRTLARAGMGVMQAHLASVAEGGDVEAIGEAVLRSLLRLLCRPEALAESGLAGAA